MELYLKTSEAMFIKMFYIVIYSIFTKKLYSLYL